MGPRAVVFVGFPLDSLALTIRGTLGRQTLIKSTLLVLGVFLVFAVVGSIITSAPSSAVVEADRKPTTTTTTEPPPEGVAFIQIVNGAFRPAILPLDLDVTQTVVWTNSDDVTYLMTSQIWEDVELEPGGQFEFDFSELPPAIYRYNGTIGFQRIPGSVDTRPSQ